MLFSSHNGLFNWTPLLLFAFIGLFSFYRNNRLLASAFLLIFLLNLGIVAGWTPWYGGQSYSHRMFINTLPGLVFGLAYLVQYLSRKISIKYVIAVLLVFVLWNFGTMVQYGSRMIPAEGPSSFMERAHNNFVSVPGKALNIFGRFLFSREEFLK